MVERQRVIQGEFKTLKKRRTQVIADIALFEERNIQLEKQVSKLVNKERKQVRN